METVSPPVSPSVVARIFIIQKESVTAGTLLSASRTIIVPDSCNTPDRPKITHLDCIQGPVPRCRALGEYRAQPAGNQARAAVHLPRPCRVEPRLGLSETWRQA